MKQFFTVFAVIFALALTAAPAEAKRFGGGKSFGKTHQTAPKRAPQKQEAAPAADKANAGAAAATAGKKGMMGGMLGGLLAGGLLGYMLGNGAFEGIQFMDILLIGLAVFIILKLLRGRSARTQASPQGAYQSSTSQPQQRTAFESSSDTLSNGSARTPLFNEIGGFAAASVPLNLPADFDLTAFLVGAREHYRALQEAWNTNDFSTIEEYVSPALHQNLALERASLEAEPHTEVLFVDAELVRADYDANLAELSLKFTGRCRNTQTNIEEDITDIWHLERDLTQANSSWLIVGIEA